jgi:predicted DNA-binding transcriptional regulator AlpA
MRRYGIGRTKLWRDVKTGRFPAPVYLPGGQRRWRLAQLLEWEANLGAEPEPQP